jgi:hypothetical protein
MSGIVAGELVDALDAAGFVVMRKPAPAGHSQLGQGHRGTEAFDLNGALAKSRSFTPAPDVETCAKGCSYLFEEFTRSQIEPPIAGAPFSPTRPYQSFRLRGR